MFDQVPSPGWSLLLVSSNYLHRPSKLSQQESACSEAAGKSAHWEFPFFEKRCCRYRYRCVYLSLHAEWVSTWILPSPRSERPVQDDWHPHAVWRGLFRVLSSHVPYRSEELRVGEV